MSQNRSIFNDGQGATTVDMQRLGDSLSTADDRALELIYTPGSIQKRILPLQEASATVNPRLLMIPSPSVGGAVRLPPCWIGIGSATNTQTLQLSATLYNATDSTAVAANSSGATRYDLVYAQVTRTVSVSATRKIKSATDGTVSNQSVNLVDSPTVTIGAVQGFLTGVTAPTAAQVASALPADTATVFYVPLCYVTVANGYVAGTTLTQSQIAQTYDRAWISPQRVRLMQPMSIFTSADTHKPSTPIGDNARWGAVRTFYGAWKHLSGGQGAVILDSSIDWTHRLIWGNALYYGTVPGGAAATAQTGAMGTPAPVSGTQVLGYIPMFTDRGGAALQSFKVNGTLVNWQLSVSSDGHLSVAETDPTAPLDSINGDEYAIVLFCTDQFVF